MGVTKLTRVFLSTWGQNDNIGDSLLRRGLLSTFQGIPGTTLHVHVGSADRFENDERYLSALGLTGAEKLYGNRNEWLRAGITGVLAERTVLVQTAGELVVRANAPWHSGWRTLLGTSLARLRGGAGVQVGAGLRMSSVGHVAGDSAGKYSVGARPPLVERVARRIMSEVAWRDHATAETFGVGGVRPDWAFAEGPDPDGSLGLGAIPAQRRTLAVSMRWDRDHLAQERITRLLRLADQHSLQVQVFSQVRRDREGAEKLAAAVESPLEPLIMGEQSHEEWEQRMRTMYRESAIVASDRAHALIMGCTEGAVPLAYSSSTIEKATRMLAPAGFETPSADAIEPYLSRALSEEHYVVDRVRRARQSVLEIRERLRSIAAG